MRPLEGLDPTAEAENDMADVEPARAATPTAAPDHATMTRALRELEAAKARVERDAARAAQELREKLVSELLPVLDNLDRTLHAAKQSGDAPSVIEGVVLVRQQFANVLERYGVSRIDARHRPFDPSQHEAVGMVPVSHPAAHNVVMDEIEPGYRFGDRLLRPAKVLVGRHARYH